MKNILLAFLFCFAAVLYAAPPSADAPPNFSAKISVQKSQPVEAVKAQNTQIFFLQEAKQVGVQSDDRVARFLFLRQSENNALFNSNFHFCAKNKPDYFSQAQANNFQLNKILPSKPHYFWRYSKRV